MWTTKDQVEAYILKYKEQVYKYSNDTERNQKLVDQLREYFRKAEERGETQLASSLERLTSPRELAKRHLEKYGYKVPRSKPVFIYVIASVFFIFVTVSIALTVATLWFLPNISKDFTKEDFSYNFHFDLNDDDNDKLSGSVEATEGKRLYIKADNINIEIDYHQDTYMTYECEVDEEIGSDSPIEITDEYIEFSLAEKFNNIDCEFKLPQEMAIGIEAANLNFEVEELSSALSIIAKNANIEIELDPNKEYFPNLKTSRALVMNEKSINASASGIPIEIALENGRIVFD